MNKIGNVQRLAKRTRETQSMNIRNENIITELGIKRIIREHYKQLFMSKLNQMKWPVLQKTKMISTHQNKTDNLNFSMAVKESESIV